jgi:hypothetical protein
MSTVPSACQAAVRPVDAPVRPSVCFDKGWTSFLLARSGVCSYYRSNGGEREGSLFLVASHCKENPMYVFLFWESRSLTL